MEISKVEKQGEGKIITGRINLRWDIWGRLRFPLGVWRMGTGGAFETDCPSIDTPNSAYWKLGL